MEGANQNRYNSYHHLPGLLMASPRVGTESNTHLHLGKRLSGVYGACFLSIILARVALSSGVATSSNLTKTPSQSCYEWHQLYGHAAKIYK